MLAEDLCIPRLKWKKGQALNAEQITEVRMAFANANARASAIADEIAAGQDSTENLYRFLEATKENIDAQVKASAVSTEAGRALGALRQRIGPVNFTQEYMEAMVKSLGGREVTIELAKKMATATRDGPLAVAKFIRNAADNVSTEPKTFGRWLGYDHVDYFEHVLFEQGEAIIRAAIEPSDRDAVQVPGLGTLRYKVELELGDGTRIASPGAEATDALGILPSVHRVSIRPSDEFLGWLGAYLLVPEVFGSAGPGKNHQTERFVGADCADVMIGAARRAGHKLAYTNVAGLPAYATTVAKATELDNRGMPSTPIMGIKAGETRTASSTAA